MKPLEIINVKIHISSPCMTLSEFLCLSTADQADYLSRYGNCLFSRMQAYYYINVYATEDFTAEVWFDLSLQYVEKITAFRGTSLLLGLQQQTGSVARILPVKVSKAGR
jgi:hypothetical protein